MQPLSLNVIREKFLAFFESKEHLRLPSFPLVPKNGAFFPDLHVNYVHLVRKKPGDDLTLEFIAYDNIRSKNCLKEAPNEQD